MQMTATAWSWASTEFFVDIFSPSAVSHWGFMKINFKTWSTDAKISIKRFRRSSPPRQTKLYSKLHPRCFPNDIHHRIKFDLDLQSQSRKKIAQSWCARGSRVNRKPKCGWNLDGTKKKSSTVGSEQVAYFGEAETSSVKASQWGRISVAKLMQRLGKIKKNESAMPHKNVTSNYINGNRFRLRFWSRFFSRSRKTTFPL